MKKVKGSLTVRDERCFSVTSGPSSDLGTCRLGLGYLVVQTWVLGSWDMEWWSQEDAVTGYSCGFSPLILQKNYSQFTQFT